MRRLIFFLEEPSAEEMLKGILPKILPEDVFPEYKVFEGKQDLEKRLPILLRAWRAPDCSFLVMRDQDSGDCRVIKAKLASLCLSVARSYVPILIRIACRELESFYLGDLAAVQMGMGISGLTEKQNTKKYREPDKLGNPSGELRWLTAGNYQKILGSRAIAPHLDVEGNKSHSFRVLVSGIRKLIQTE
jgi:Domain of unknown function (DUF4276)